MSVPWTLCHFWGIHENALERLGRCFGCLRKGEGWIHRKLYLHPWLAVDVWDHFSVRFLALSLPTFADSSRSSSIFNICYIRKNFASVFIEFVEDLSLLVETLFKKCLPPLPGRRSILVLLPEVHVCRSYTLNCVRFSFMYVHLSSLPSDLPRRKLETGSKRILSEYFIYDCLYPFLLSLFHT
jgi:hypothetical protein